MSDVALPDVFVLNPHVAGLSVYVDELPDEQARRVRAWADDWLRNNGARYGLEHWGVPDRVYARFVRALVELGEVEGFTVTCWD